MIKVDVVSKDDGFLDIKVSGHANSVLCASVSTLLQTQLRYLQYLEQEFPNELQVNVDLEEF